MAPKPDDMNHDQSFVLTSPNMCETDPAPALPNSRSCDMLQLTMRTKNQKIDTAFQVFFFGVQVTPRGDGDWSNRRGGANLAANWMILEGLAQCFLLKLIQKIERNCE